MYFDIGDSGISSAEFLARVAPRVCGLRRSQTRGFAR